MRVTVTSQMGVENIDNHNVDKAGAYHCKTALTLIYISMVYILVYILFCAFNMNSPVYLLIHILTLY